jgi:hypothetical protein
MPTSFGRLLAAGFVRSGALAISLIGVAITTLQLVWKPSLKADAVWLVILGTLAIGAVATTLHAAFTAHAAALKRLPRVRLAKPALPSYRGLLAVLLLDPSELFVTDAAVSLYYMEEEDYEAMFGAGRVTTIQDNGLIQVGITYVVPERQSLLERVLANDATALKSLLVKPHMPMSFYAIYGEDK